MAKLEDEDLEKDEKIHGHVTSISVLRSHRKLGIATKLMKASQYAMMTIYDAEYCSLHVRRGNRAAISLYRDALGFQVIKVDEKYYGDGEDAFDMRVYFKDMKINKPTVEEESKQHEKEAEALAIGDEATKGTAQ